MSSRFLYCFPSPWAARRLSLLLFLATLGFACIAAAQARLTVEWTAGRLSVHAVRVPLAQVVQDVARRTGLAVQGLSGLQELVTVRFVGLSLAEGLERLLAERDYALLVPPPPQRNTQPMLVVGASRRVPAPGEGKGRGAEVQEDTGPPETPLDEEPPGEGEAPEDPDPAADGVSAPEEAPEARAAALRTLVREGTEEALRGALLTPDAFVEDTLFQVLDGGERQRVLILLAKASQREEGSLRQQALRLLARGRQEETATTVAGFRAALAAEVAQIQEQAARALTPPEGADAQESLRQAFRAADRPLKVLLLERGAQQAEGRALLQEAMGDADEVVRTFAAFYLQQTAPEGR